MAFVNDVRERVVGRVQVTTDGHGPYIAAVADAFGADVDYAVLQKIYGSDPAAEKRYSPAQCLGTKCEIIPGEPNPKHINTSYVERQNLTMRMHMRRFTRLTNAFSKKFENHVYMVALYTVFYNWTKIHKTTRVTPAMAAGLTETVWTMADVVENRGPRDLSPVDSTSLRTTIGQDKQLGWHTRYARPTGSYSGAPLSLGRRRSLSCRRFMSTPRLFVCSWEGCQIPTPYPSRSMLGTSSPPCRS